MTSKKYAWLHASVLVFTAAACPSSGDKNDDMQTTTTAGTMLPCDVATLLSQHCAKCHGSVPGHGAPLSLLQPTDFQAMREGSTVGAIALERLRNPTARRMPPPPDPEVTDAEVEVMRAFVTGGALGVATGCAVQEPMMTMTMTGSGGTTGTGGTTGSGGMTGMTIPPADAGSGGSGMTDAGTMMNGTTADWTSFGYDLTNSRNNAGEHTLSPDNVKSLHKIWEWTEAATTSTPAVVEGVVYLPAWDGKVYALNAADGTPVWTATLPNLIDSSPAVSSDLVFVSDNKGSVHAIGRSDGMVKWSTPVDTNATAHLWSSPVYIADPGIVVVGVASGEESNPQPYSFRGSVVALDAQSGMMKWQFFTTDNDQASGPGVSVWDTAAVDTTRKVLYVGTGNNYSAPAGPLEDSLLAIDYTTGSLVWSHQFTNNDVFTVLSPGGPDSDLGSSASLFSVDGTDYIGIGVKNGIYYELDREHGDMKWMSMLTAGSVLGGVISAGAYADGVAFAASNRYGEGMTDTCAIDVRDGKVLWRQTAPMITYGAVAHANGVLYMGTTAGTVYALDGANGDVLWMADAPDSIAGGPAVADGKLFVPWGYQWTLGQDGQKGSGGLMVFGL